MTAKVIVISVVTAGGKTTLITALSWVLPGNRIDLFDDYSFKSPRGLGIERHRRYQ